MDQEAGPAEEELPSELMPQQEGPRKRGIRGIRKLHKKKAILS
jgi:hypothetical protein